MITRYIAIPEGSVKQEGDRFARKSDTTAPTSDIEIDAWEETGVPGETIRTGSPYFWYRPTTPLVINPLTKKFKIHAYKI